VRFVIWVAVNALALAAAAWLLDGIRLTGQNQVLHLLLVAVIFGVVNLFVRPLVKLLSLPLIILTLGLMIFVINALMLMLTGWISDQVGLGYHVEGFWTAVGGAIVVTLATWALEIVLPDGKGVRR
jgi:putative membrane protein